MLNEKIFYFFYNLSNRSPLFDDTVVFLAVYFPFVVVVAALIFMFFYKKSFWNTFWVFFTAGVAWGVAHVLKAVIGTARPFDSLPEVTSLFTQTSNAFPSGHTTFFTALGFAIFFLYKKAGYAFIVLALVIGLARVMAGVHFPIDILGGFVLGVLIAIVMEKLGPKIKSLFGAR